MTPPLVRTNIKKYIQQIENKDGIFESIDDVKDHFGNKWSKAAYDATLEYFDEHKREITKEEKRETNPTISEVIPKKKTREQAIKELEEKPTRTAKERRALKNLRIKQRREARKMRRVEKRLRCRK